MHQYIFIFGQNPALSYAEIRAVFNYENISHQVVQLFSYGVVLQTQGILDAEFIKKLGGIVKVGQLIDIQPEASALADFLVVSFPAEDKIFFGFSLYADGDNFKKRLGLEVKKILRDRHHRASRWVESRESVLSSVIAEKEHLLDRGADFLILKDSKTAKFIVGKTIAVQEFKDYGRRDYGRPEADPRSGMMPPKLGKMMINLALSDLESPQIFLDPFCGSGTIAAEAILTSRFTRVIGTDKDGAAVASCRKNIEWLMSEYPETRVEVNIFQADARHLAKRWPGEKADAIVTELVFGPPLKSKLAKGDVLKIKKELEALYREAFLQLSLILAKNGAVVCAFPVWYLAREPFRAKALEDAGDFVFTDWQSLIPASFCAVPLLDDSRLDFYLKDRGSIIYGRPDQKVLREVVKFIKTPPI
ncbi:MAG: RsmD family RNA methyltransferase [Parcubacteria group bacterium]|nr:RsmD family RNA methyltransferase [Parcubacteria group bacterium]